MFQPIGIDQWVYELALKYGMRDGFTCPIAGRWVVVFWSRRDLSKVLTPQARIVLFAAASFAALRLEPLACLDVDRIGFTRSLDPREQRSCVWCRWAASCVRSPRFFGSARRQSSVT